MKEYQAWRLLAKKWAKPNEFKGQTCVFMYVGFSPKFRYEHMGLCGSLDVLFHKGLITHNLELQMLSRLPHRASSEYIWPLTKAGAKKRAAFCRRMVKVCAKEAQLTVAMYKNMYNTTGGAP